MIKFIMDYLTEYSYGQIGAIPARKLLLTGKVEVFNAGAWIKCTKKASKEFVEAAAPEEDKHLPPPPATMKTVPKRRGINAAAVPEVAPDPNAPPIAIDHAAVRRRAEAEIQESMLRQRSEQALPPVQEGEEIEEQPMNFTGSDPELLAQAVEEIVAGLYEVQFSSAQGYRDLQMLRERLRDALHDYRGIIPEMEQNG